MTNLIEAHQWLSLLPPILAIGLALSTRQVFLSLAAGIWLGFVILAGGNPFTGMLAAVEACVAVFSDAGNTRVIIFTLLVGALIALIQRSGGVDGFVARLLSWLDGLSEKANGRGQRKLVELLAVLTGLLLFVESNISILTVGTVYRPVFDKLGIPREKLAYITDSTASPSCILIPFNAWGAFITGLIAAQGIANPFGTLLAATAVNFYPMLVFATLIFVILSGKDIGEMKRAERRAAASGDLIREGAQVMMQGGAAAVETKDEALPRARFMLLPILAMVILMPSFLVMTGEGSGVLTRLQSGSGSKSVLYATSFAVLFAMGLYKAFGVMKIRESFAQSLSGMAAMVPLAILMVLAFALGALCRELGTGQYVADVASGLISPALVPAMIFLIACFVAFSTGTSWGTFAIMIAISVPLAQSMDANLNLAIAASLGGGIFGDHCSPTSDTSIITSMATANDHIDHIRTQIPYALIGGGITVLLYLILGVLGV